jgi:hypothetical protein
MTSLRLFVVCTDKGQHQRARLGELNVWEGPSGRDPAYNLPTDDNVEWVSGSNEVGKHLNYVPEDAMGVRIESIAVPLSGVHGGHMVRVQIDCPRCSRHVEWREETAKKVIAGMCADSPVLGETTHWREAWLDISHLP